MRDKKSRERFIKLHQKDSPEDLWKCRYCGGKMKSHMSPYQHLALSPKCKAEHERSGNVSIRMLKPVNMLTDRDCGRCVDDSA